MPATLSTVEFVLPAPWASYLINGDASGLPAEEVTFIDAFLARQQATQAIGAALTCDEESWFARHNDANTGLSGEVTRFVFPVLATAQAA